MNFTDSRFRFAPSPTGFLHIGGVRTALFNWLLARKYKGKFILRIEDTDTERSTQESINAILDGFRWLGMDWDEGPDIGGPFGPYYQSQRKPTYDLCSEKLIAQGRAYRCFCTKEELDAKRQEAENVKKHYTYDKKCADLSDSVVSENISKGMPFSIRLRVDTTNHPLFFTDMIRGLIDFSHNQYDDFIIVRPDNMPVYNYAVTIDDALMKITHVIRGDDHISNTPRQILIYRALDLPIPEFAHLPMILGSDGSRLSKRHGATAVQQYREEGYLPDALLNFLARLGWSYDDTQEFFSRSDLIEKFSIEKVSKSSAVFNSQKLLWLNAEYVKLLTLEEKYFLCKDYFIKAGLLTSEQYAEKKSFVLKLIELAGDRLKLISQITEHTHYFFRDKIEYDNDSYTKFIKVDFVPDLFKTIIAKLDALADWSFSSIEMMFKDVIAEKAQTAKKVMQAVRVAMAGSAVSPDLVTIILLYGKEMAIRRLKDILEKEGQL